MQRLFLTTFVLCIAIDYVGERSEASGLVHARKPAEALAAFTELAGGAGISDFQKSDALEQAALWALIMKTYDGGSGKEKSGAYRVQGCSERRQRPPESS